MDDFYVILPSDGSMDVYPNNTSSQFTIQLRDALTLNGDWEVAVVETNVPSRWSNVDEECSIRIHIPNKGVVEERIMPNFYDGNRQLLSSVNRIWKKTISGELFSYDDVTHALTRLDNHKHIVEVTKKLGMLLGYVNYENENESWITIPIGENQQPMDRFRGIHNMFLYADIVKYRAIGHIKSPLLRVIPLQPYVGGSRAAVDTQIYNTPHYLPVSRQRIEEITIHIRSNMGEYIPFIGGASIVTLHFKKRRPDYI